MEKVDIFVKVKNLINAELPNGAVAIFARYKYNSENIKRTLKNKLWQSFLLDNGVVENGKSSS